MTIEESFELAPVPTTEAIAPAPPGPVFDDAELVRQLAAENFTALDREAQDDLIVADLRVAVERREQGELNQHVGQHVAFLRGQFVGASRNLSELYEQVEQRFHVSPHRPAVIFVDDFWLLPAGR